LLKLNRRVV